MDSNNKLDFVSIVKMQSKEILNIYSKSENTSGVLVYS